jgi:asparagine synthase (glutamine-hydrolysing)
MCGIAGLFTVERPVDADLVAAALRMLDRQVHRGPNDWGILVPEGALRDPQVRGLLESRGLEHVRAYPGGVQAPAAVLGARRLSILDLSTAGRMPMGTPDGRLWLTYNGEIYNFAELRSELVARGHTFRSQGDTETLLLGYREWGPEVVHRLRGMFAFAVLDARAPDGPRLFLAKDRFGIKPLYWGRHRCVLQFASEVRALMAGGLMPDEPEPRGFHGFLVHGSVPMPWTTVRDVMSLPAAHSLAADEVSYSYPKPRRYWSLPEAGSLRISYPEAVVETRRLLDESVRMHLVSDVPLGVFLSGGMDSTALVALAARHLPHPLTTLSVTFDEAEFSEGDQAAATATRHGTKHVEVRLRAQEFCREAPRVLAAMDQPTIDGVNTYFVAKAAREAGVTVALSGVGGDEAFWGYPGFRRAPAVARLAALPGAGLAASVVARAAALAGFPAFQKLEFLRGDPAIGPYLTVRGMFSPRQAARILDAEPLPLWTPDRGASRLDGARYGRLEMAHYLQNQLLRDTDVFGMSHSVEIRVPLLDHRLVETVFALPPGYMQASGRNKPLLADAMGEDWDGGPAKAPKRGFTFPFARWMHQAVAAQAAPFSGSDPVAAPASAGILAAFAKGRIHWSRVWALGVLAGMRDRGAIPSWTRDGDIRRVLLFLPEVHASSGGVQTYCRYLTRAAAERLPRSGVRVVAVNDSEPPDDPSLRGRVDFTPLGPRGKALHKVRLGLATLGAALGRRPDVIVCGHLRLMPLAGLIGWLRRAPVLLMAYGIEVWQRPPLWQRAAAARARRVLAISQVTADRMASWYGSPERIEVLSNCVDPEVFRPVGSAGSRDEVTLLTVARLVKSERYKGVDRILRILPLLEKHWPRLRYVVVGQGDDVPRLQALARELGVAGLVRFEGRVADEQLASVYSQADVFAMLSENEGFGFVYIEALACGVAVVAGNRDGSTGALLGGRLGTLVDLEEPSAIVEAIVASASRDPDTRHRLRSEVLRHFGFEEFARRFSELLGASRVAVR